MKNGRVPLILFALSAVIFIVIITVYNIAIFEQLHALDFQGVGQLHESISWVIRLSVSVVGLLIILTAYSWYQKNQSLKAIEKSAYNDPLTGLYNLAGLKLHMSKVLNKNKDKKYTIIKVDVDNFKAINELFSYEIGNRVLMAFKDIRNTVSEPTLVIARTGADEFMLFSGNGFLDDMEERTHLYEAYYNKFIPELGSYQIEFKYGRYHIELGETDVDSIVNNAVLAHRMSKNQKNYIIYDYDDKIKTRMMEDAELSNRMRSAMSSGEFVAYLQPKFNIANDTLIGAEALVRWIKSDGKMVYPDRFIPLFERNGFIVELDRYVLKCVCDTLKKWSEQGRCLVPISVNCSRLNLANPNFVDEISQVVDGYGISHEYIEIELTESTMIENEDQLEQLFIHLRKHGFRVSIDDFGSGFSSLGLLKNLKVDTLKIDKSFFRNKKDIVRGDLIVDGIIKLAQSLNMFVVAEGVEEQQQLELLKFVGCDAVQGYFYAKPMPISEFEQKYDDPTIFGDVISTTDASLSSPTDNSNNQKFEMVLNILNSIKVPVMIFNHSFTVLRCNFMTLEMFQITGKEEYQREFFNLSPEFQPDGRPSTPTAIEYINNAKNTGYEKFFWMHRTSKGADIPCEVTISKLHLLDNDGEELYLGVVNDMRAQLADFEEDNFSGTGGFFYNRITDKTLFNIVTSLSDEWFFCYDIKEETMQFFGEGGKRINLPQGRQKFPDKQITEKLIYPDDIAKFESFVDTMRDGVEKTFHIRLNQPDGNAKSYRFIYHSIVNNNEPTFAVGKTSELAREFETV